MSLLDIIIVNYNSTDYLLQCLRSVYDSLQGVPAKIFVQDNNSQDGINRVIAMFPQVNLTKNNYNMGFSKAVNRGLEQCTAPYILILNPDTVILNGFFELILQYLEENQDVGIVGSQILNLDGSVQGSARSFPTPLTGLFGRNSPLSRYFPNSPISRSNILTTRSDSRTPMEVDWVSGACMVVKRKAVADVKLMDERFFLYWEDADWCRRMRELGWRVVYFPKASAYHYVGGSSQKIIFRSVIEFHKSVYRLFDKYAKGPLRFLKPIAIGALSFRLLIVFIQHGIKKLLEKGLDCRVERRLGINSTKRRRGLDHKIGKDRRKREEKSKVSEMSSGKDRRNDPDRRNSIERRATF